jgi:replicative DNA helicase
VLASESNFWSVNDSVRDFHFFREIHQKIYAAIRDILNDGKKVSLTLIESRIGEEYDDGQSVMILLTALLRDCEDVTDWATESEDIIDKWRSRRLLQVVDEAKKAALKPDVMSADLLSELEVRIQDISTNSQAEPLKSVGDIAQRVVARSSRTKETGIVPGFDTGLSSLDEILGRIHAGDLGYIAARQGDGKTLLGLQLAMRAQQFMPSCFFELEMRDEDLTARVLAGKSDVPVASIEAGDYDAFAFEDLKAARDKLASTRLYIDDRPKLAIEQIRDRCRYLKRSKDLGFVVIDHIRLVRSFAKFQNKFDRMEYVSGELKALAKDLKIAVVVLSQVTRASQRREDPFPTITDLDAGGPAEQDSDWVLAMIRRERYLKNQQPNNDPESRDFREWVDEKNRWKDRIEIRCLKRRRGSDGETREFVFDGRRGAIKELER